MEICIKVSFITVNFNGFLHTINLLDTIFHTLFPFPYEVIIIDNGSKTNEFEALKKKYPAIRGMYHAENVGFAGGNNIGIKLARGEYLYFLNNDTLLPKDAGKQIAAMIDFCQDNPAVGGLSPKILYDKPIGLIQFAGCTPLSTITLRNKQIGYKKQDLGQYNTVKEIPYMHGAAMFVPRQVVITIGPMPELFFLYYEELDWSCQIAKQYKLYYYPEAYVYHMESASTGINSPLKAYYMSRNRIIFAFRQRRGLTRSLTLAYLTFIATPLALARYGLHGKGEQMQATGKGAIAAYNWIFNPKK